MLINICDFHVGLSFPHLFLVVFVFAGLNFTFNIGLEFVFPNFHFIQEIARILRECDL